jgi:hypothetical protein
VSLSKNTEENQRKRWAVEFSMDEGKTWKMSISCRSRREARRFVREMDSNIVDNAMYRVKDTLKYRLNG